MNGADVTTAYFTFQVKDTGLRAPPILLIYSLIMAIAFIGSPPAMKPDLGKR